MATVKAFVLSLFHLSRYHQSQVHGVCQKLNAYLYTVTSVDSICDYIGFSLLLRRRLHPVLAIVSH